MTIREMLTVWGFEVNTEELERTEKKLKSVQDIAGKVFKVTGAAIAGAVTTSSIAYDNIIDSLTITNVKGQEFIDTQEEMLDMTLMLADEMNTFATGVSESYYGGISSGAELMSDQFKELTSTALKFGKVIKMDTGTAIESLSDVTQGLGKDLTEVDTVANGLFLTSKQAATNVPQLVEAFRDAGPVTNALNRTFNETMAILAALAQSGKKGAQAGTAFRSVMTKLAAPNAKAKKSLDNLGVSLFDNEGKLRNMIDIIGDLQNATKNMTAKEKTQLFKKLAGEEGFATLSLLMKANVKQMKGWEKETKNAGDVLQEAFDKKMESPLEQMKKLLVGIMNVSIAIGRHFIPPLVVALKFINAFISSFVKFLTLNKPIAALIALVTTLIFAISGVIFAYTSWRIAVLGMNTAFKLLNISMGIAQLKMIAFGLLAAAAIAIVVFALQDLYGFLTGDYDSVLQHVVDNWDAAWGENLNGFESFLKSIGDYFIDALVGWQMIVQNFGEILASPWTFMYTVASTILEELYNKFLGVSGFMSKSLNSALNIVGLGEDEESFDKAIDDINKKSLNDLGSFFDKNIAKIAAFENVGWLSSSSAPVGSNITNQNTTTRGGDTSVSIVVDGSRDPQAVGQEIKKILSTDIRQSNNDLKTKVAY